MRNLLVVITLVTAGCAGTRARRAECQKRDWFEIGRSDGAQGAEPARVARFRGECGGRLDPHAELVYLNGRNAGLVDYCAPESAFELGRAGRPYLAVCPPTIEPAFLAQYRRGLAARAVIRR